MALTAERDALKAARVKVKPLVWMWNGALWGSDCIIGQYRVAKTDNPRNDRYMVTYLYRGPNGKAASHTIGYVDGAETAKAAAQADYEARILAAMDLTPDTSQIDTIRAALEEAHDAIAEYPRVAPGVVAMRYDEQIEHSQHIIRAIDPSAIAAKLKGESHE